MKRKTAQNQKRRQWSLALRRVQNARRLRGYAVFDNTFIPKFVEISGPLVVSYSRPLHPNRNYSFPFTKRTYPVNRWVQLGIASEVSQEEVVGI